MYRPIQPSSAPVTSNTSLMGKRGVNKRDLPQFLSIDHALNIENYLITSDGGIVKRGGLQRLLSGTGTGNKMLEEYTTDNLIFAYDNTLSVFNQVTEVETIIKSDFNGGTFEGVRAGNYFLVANSEEAIGRVSQTLAYDAQTTNFLDGETITGGTSGATATILEQADGGASGTLTIGSITGTFEDNELITSTSGSADVNGTLSFVYTPISGAPIAKTINLIGSRLFAGVGPSVQYSAPDDGITNPPFNNWTVSTTATDGGRIAYRNGGTVNAIDSIGNQTIVAFADNGKWAFSIDITDVAGVQRKIDREIMFREDAGGQRATLQTKEGIFYVNSRGVWQLTSVGQADIKFSDQEVITSELLGNNYFDDVDFSQADLAYNEQINTLFVTLRKDSNINNLVLAYNTEFKSYAFITGWNINRFLQIGDLIYGGDASTNKLYQCFSGSDDDGNDIWTQYYQEVNTGDVNSRKSLLGQYMHTILSPDSNLQMRFDTFDRNGEFAQDVCVLNVIPQGTTDSVTEYGSASWGAGAWGGDVDVVGTFEQFSGYRARINNYQRIRVKFSSNDKSPHKISYFTLITKQKVPIRRRNLTKQ